MSIDGKSAAFGLKENKKEHDRVYNKKAKVTKSKAKKLDLDR